MDPISTALLAAITAGLTVGIQDTAKTAIGDLYAGLKGLIQSKAGADATSVGLIKLIEADPEMEALQQTLPAALKNDGIADDSEVLSKAEELLKKLGTDAPEAITNIQKVIGDYNAVAGPGGHASVSVNKGGKTS